MNTDEERQRAVAAIDTQIAALIEDGVPADSSRNRALKAKRAVAQKSKKAIKRSVRKARERQAAAVSPPSLFSLGTSSSPSHEVGTETTMSLAKVPGGGTGQGVKVRPVSFSYAST